MAPKISIHVDGYYGLVLGVPRILDLLKKYNLKATFFVNMGREANLLELLKYRSNGLREKDKKIIKRYSKIQMIKMAFLQRKIGSGHSKILKEIVQRGHEIQPHGWSHLKWSKNFEKLSYKKEIYLMKKSFFRAVGFFPTKFVAPDWKINSKVLSYLEKQGFKEVCILKKDIKFFLRDLKIKPDILSFDKTPEELLQEGKTKQEILSIYKQEFAKKDAHLYFHADYEGLTGLNLFDEILRELKK